MGQSRHLQRHMRRDGGSYDLYIFAILLHFRDGIEVANRSSQLLHVSGCLIGFFVVYCMELVWIICIPMFTCKDA